MILKNAAITVNGMNGIGTNAKNMVVKKIAVHVAVRTRKENEDIATH